MSPTSQNGWNGTSLPPTLREPHRRWMSDAYPQMTDAGVIDRGSSLWARRVAMDSWMEPLDGFALLSAQAEWLMLYPERSGPSPEALERLEALLTQHRAGQRARWEADMERGKVMLERAREVSLAVRAEREEASA